MLVIRARLTPLHGEICCAPVRQSAFLRPFTLSLPILRAKAFTWNANWPNHQFCSERIYSTPNYSGSLSKDELEHIETRIRGTPPLGTTQQQREGAYPLLLSRATEVYCRPKRQIVPAGALIVRPTVVKLQTGAIYTQQSKMRHPLILRH